MKLRLLIPALLLLLPGISHAQQMIGFRQGVTLWFQKNGLGQGSLNYAQGQHFTWDKELFFRDAIDKKWHYEATLSTFSFSNTHPEKRREVISEKNTVIRTGYSLQYDVTYPLFGYLFPFMQRMKSYVGLNTAHLIWINQYDILNVDNELRRKKSDVNVTMMLGFSYTHVIPLSKRLNVTSVLSFNTNTFSKYGATQSVARPNKSVNWLGGLAYTLY